MKMPTDNIDTIMFAPCGMNCKVCYKHCYHKKPCAGCFNSDKGKPEHCRKCKIKDCIKNKGLTYCFECSDYPCKLIENLEKSYNKRYQASLMDNSEFVRQHGLEAFMEKQKEKYTCSNCGGVISIHDKECSECQEKVTDEIPYGFCGMPCALCPYYHTKGISRCKGCSHDGFFTGACNIYKCCKRKDLLHCAVCSEYPCKNCASLKEFNCLNTNSAWLRTVASIQSNSYDDWYAEYQRKAELLNFALEHYNSGKMKRYLCELFINTGIEKIELIMKQAFLLTGNKKELSLKFKELVKTILEK